MSQIILSNCKCLVGSYDLSGKLNAIALNDNPDLKDNTTFGMTAKSRKKGLDLITADLEGFFEEIPDAFISDFTLINVPMTIAPEPTVGGPGYSFLSQKSEYNWGGMVGELAKFSVKSESVGTKMIRGHVLENGATARIASGAGTAFEFGAIGPTQYLYGVLHVFSAATVVGDTLTVSIQSDNLEAFGDPTPQIAFTAALGNGGGTYQWATPVGGPIADTWWRASWAVVDSDDPSFNFFVFMGIA